MKIKSGGEHACDVCKADLGSEASIASNTSFWRCNDCDYDVCKACADKKQKKEKHVRIAHEILNATMPTKDFNVELNKDALKKEMYIVFIGNVDAGKSTLVGDLLTKMQIVKEQEMRKIA